MKERREALGAWGFLAPFLILFSLFVLLPVVYGFWISLHNWHILSSDVRFVGMQNYASAINDDLFRISLVRTAYFAFMVVPVGNLLSLLFAVLLNQNYRGTALYKIAFYTPVLLSVTVVSVLWRWLYSHDYGLLNHYLKTDVRWLEDPKFAMPALALMSVWWGVGGNMLIYLAGLRSVPKELHEAAALDGASAMRRFWTTTWPWIRPVTLFCVVMSIIGASQVFGQSYILTQGGPAYSTLTVILYMYQQGFNQYQLGYASAVAYLLFIAVFAVTLVQWKLMSPAKDGD